MTRSERIVLRAFAVWTVWVWGTRIGNVVRDHTPGHGAAFKTVHVVLAAVSVAFAVAALVIASRAARRAAATASVSGVEEPAGR